MKKLRKNIRLKDYDYKSDGYYFITICTALMKPYLTGGIEKIVENTILSLTQKISSVKVDFYKIMPTHIHLILILEKSNLTLSEIIRRLKSITTKESKIKPLWEWNFYEHIIRNENALEKIRNYILYNAEKHNIDITKIDKIEYARSVG